MLNNRSFSGIHHTPSRKVLKTKWLTFRAQHRIFNEPILSVLFILVLFMLLVATSTWIFTMQHELEPIKGLVENDQNKLRPTVIMGPSGVGKGTLLRALSEHFKGRMSVAVSHTTRKPRTGEVDGVHYHFVSTEQFQKDIKEGKFVEYRENYGHHYGTSTQAINDVAEQQKICLLEMDYVGVQLIKQSDIEANYLFITVKGEAETCRKRVEKRGTENAGQIEKRYRTAISEFKFFNEHKNFFDESLSNDDLEQAKQEIVEIFKKWYPWL